MSNAVPFFSRAAALAALLAFGAAAFARAQDPPAKPKPRAEAAEPAEPGEGRTFGDGEPIKDDPEGRAEWFKERFGPIARGYLAHRQAVAEREIERWGALIPGTAAHKSARANRANIGPSSGIQENVWRSIGPFSGENNYSPGSTQIDTGRVTVILSHPVTPNLLYVGYAGGGLWRCRNADPAIDGDWNWECLTDGLPAGTAAGNVSIGSAAFKPGDPSTIYLSMGDMMPGSAMAGDVGSGTPQGRGFYISSDGGDTWTAGGALGGTTRTKTVLAVPGDVVLVAGNAGLWRSTNGGATFAQVSGIGSSVVWDILRLDGGDLVVSFQGGTAYSTDNGATWTNGVRTGMPSGSVYRIAMAANGQTLYGLFEQASDSFPKGLMKSTDGGRNWFYQAAPTLFAYSSGDGGQSGYNQMIAVDPEDPNTVFVGANLCLYRSVNGGLTFEAMSHWASSNRHYIHADLHVAAWSALGPKALYIGTDGGMSIVRKPNISPIPTSNAVDHTYIDNRRNKNVATHLIYNIGCTAADEPAGSRQRVMIGLQDNGTRLRRENGVAAGAFNEVIGGDGFGCLIHAKNGNLMLGSLYSLRIYRSANGSYFSQSTSGLPSSNVFYTRLFDAAADPDGNRVYTISYTDIYASNNFGQSWAALPRYGNGWPGGTIRSFGASPLKLGLIGATVGSSTVAVSDNNGESWRYSEGLPGIGGSLGEMTFDTADEYIMYVTSVSFTQTANHLWKTTDGGYTWASIDGSPSVSNGFPFGVPVHAVRVDPLDNNVVYAGTDVGLYRSEDQGASWARFGYDLPLMSVRDIYVAPDGSFIRLGTHGRGVWEMTAPISVTVGPKASTLAPGATRRFTAVVVGGEGNHSVAWHADAGSITADGLYTAPQAVGTVDTVTAVSLEDPTKSDAASVRVARLTITSPAKGLFTGGTMQFGASLEGVSDDSVAWNVTGGGGISLDGLLTAPDTPRTVTVTAISLQEPTLSASVQVKVSASDFDGNAKTDPQLLGLAAAFGSTLGLDKYDFDGDGAVGDGDLTTLFVGMEW